MQIIPFPDGGTQVEGNKILVFLEKKNQGLKRLHLSPFLLLKSGLLSGVKNLYKSQVRVF